MLRVVLDTDVVLAAMRSPSGASAALLRAAYSGRLSVLASAALVFEYEAVLTRPEHHGAAGLSQEDARSFVDGVAGLARRVHTHFKWRPQVRDPNDEMVLEAAINGAAELLVTYNVRDYGLASAKFGFGVLSPGPTLLRVRYG